MEQARVRARDWVLVPALCIAGKELMMCWWVPELVLWPVGTLARARAAGRLAELAAAAASELAAVGRDLGMEAVRVERDLERDPV